MRHLAVENMYTLVAYPVAYHFDSFKHNMQSLENKICFKIKRDATNNLQMGRGGYGSQYFCFALLDWTNSDKGRCRRHYIANGGVLNANQRLTQEMWITQFGFDAPLP